MIKKLALVLLLSAFAVACSDNIMEGASDKESSDAKQHKLEMALDSKDYDYIISTLGRGSDNYSTLSLRNKYLLQLAWLGKTKFDVLANLDKFFEKDINTTTVLTSLQTDSHNLDNETIKAKLVYYTKVLGMVKADNGTKDNDIEMVGGIAAAMEVLMSLSDVALNLTQTLKAELNAKGYNFDNISFDENDPNYIVNVFDNISQVSIDNTVIYNAIDTVLPVLNNDLDQIVAVVDTLVPASADSKEEVKEKLNEYIDNMSEVVNGQKVVTSQSAYDFLMTYMNKK